MIAIERTFDPALVNGIANDPDIRPWVADPSEGPIDLAPRIGDHENVIALAGEHGVFIVYRYGPGVWEIHTLVRRSGRGAWAVWFAEAGLRFMFVETCCQDLITRTPAGHVAAVALTRRAGFIEEFTTLPETKFRGQLVPVTVWSLPLVVWAAKAAGMEQSGAEFHAWLHSHDLIGTPHEDDPAHNQTVGVALAMIRAGQVHKGIWHYNRAALASRHQTIQLISMDPVQVGFDAGVLSLAADGSLQLEARH